MFAVGVRRKGNDGRWYVVKATRTGVKRWAPLDASVIDRTSTRHVDILCNGGISFFVDLVFEADANGPGSAYVSIVDYDDATKVAKARKPIWKIVQYQRAFVGIDPEENSWRRLIFGPRPYDGGNAVLLQVGRHKYLCVCDRRVMQFTTDEEIAAFASPIGNGGVAYPYATGATTTFLLCADVWVRNTMLEHLRSMTSERDPHVLFWGHDWETGNQLSSNKTKSRDRKIGQFEKKHKIAYKMLMDRDDI